MCEVCTNGGMKLFCVSGYKQKNAIFIRLNDGLVIKALRVDWTKGNENITWGQGNYYKNVGELLKEVI